MMTTPQLFSHCIVVCSNGRVLFPPVSSSVTHSPIYHRFPKWTSVHLKPSQRIVKPLRPTNTYALNVLHILTITDLGASMLIAHCYIILIVTSELSLSHRILSKCGLVENALGCPSNSNVSPLNTHTQIISD